MTTKNLLVELFVEELPPKALKKLGDAFSKRLFDELVSTRFVEPEQEKSVVSYASPRRLATWIPNVYGSTPNTKETKKLMPAKVAYGSDGKPTTALLKKLESLGYVKGAVPSDDLYAEADHVFLKQEILGKNLLPALQMALDSAVKGLPIPKVMTYQLADGWSDVKFVRPAHGLVALHGSDVVAVKALGLKAGNITHGHRFEAPVDPVVLMSADSYADVLRKDGAVIASFSERKAEIAKQLAAAAAKVGGGVTAIDDDALLDEVTALVERPNVLICEFEKEFLDVPQECLILTMKANQKYFPLLDAAGKLTNKFLVVSNITPADASAVIGGNERVVRPRLADAKFFFDQDRKKTLESRVAGLDKVVYHNKLGSQGERMLRVRKIAEAIANRIDVGLVAHVHRAAELAKTDLVTDMVGEFPELQGVMGRYYALNDGWSVDVADAIEDHYKPRFAGDDLPRNKVGVIVALADKLETLVGMFGIGNLPTGDKDPFALRRHALGVIRMLVEKEVPLTVAELTKGAQSVFGDKIQDASAALSDFVYDRFAGSLREQGYSAQEVDSVLSLKPPHLGDVAKRLAAVRTFTALPEAPALAAANKRVSNILKKAEGTVEATINEALLIEPAEKELASALKTVAAHADIAWAAGDYTGNLQALAALKESVDAFFESVMVNAEDPALKANRLGLLAKLHQAMNRVADLSKLAT